MHSYPRNDLCYGHKGVQGKIRENWPVEYQANPGNPTGKNQHTANQESLPGKDSSSYGNSTDYLLNRLKEYPGRIATLTTPLPPFVHRGLSRLPRSQSLCGSVYATARLERRMWGVA